MTQTNFQTIDQYIETFPKDVQEKLEQIRTTIKKVAPEAEEVISYNMPTFNLNGKYLVYFAGWKDHISLYPISENMEKNIKELSQYKTSGKGTVRFPLDQPLPLDLIRQIVELRVKEREL